MPRERKYLVWALGLLVASSLAFGSLVGGGSRRREDLALARVERGALEIEVVERGILVAPRSLTIASEIESNRAKVVRLTPEGTLVAKGDLLVEFDAAPFLEDVTKYSRAVKEAEANLEQARQDLALARQKTEQLAEDAALRLRLAELELEGLEKGGGPLTQKESRARVDQAEEQLLYASQAAADAEEFLRQGFITRKEHEEALARRSDAERARALAVAQHENLIRYRQPADLERARASLERARQERERLGETSRHEAARQEAVLTKAEMAVEAARADLAKAKGELAKARLFAPASGFLVYNEIPVGSDYRKLQIGDSVWQGQAIMTIPDTSEMAVETSIREFDVHKVKPGQRASVSLEAFPGLRLDGRVEFVGNLATDRRSDGAEKQFSLRMLLDGTDPRLRPGMTAEVAIDVETLANVLLVPVEAVFQRDGRSVCWVRSGGELVEREIQLGASDEDRAVVLAGLEAGDLVSLAPRSESSWALGRF